jgi:hypothetical protein
VILLLALVTTGLTLWFAGKLSVFKAWSTQAELQDLPLADDPEMPPPYSETGNQDTLPDRPRPDQPIEEIELYSMPVGHEGRAGAPQPPDTQSLLQQLSALCSRAAARNEGVLAESATNWQYANTQPRPTVHQAPDTPAPRPPGSQRSPHSASAQLPMAARLQRAPSRQVLAALPPLPSIPMPQGAGQAPRSGPGRTSGRRRVQLPLSRTASLPRGLVFE